MSTGLTVAAIVLSIPLMLVGIRVLGETNWGPISALTNMMQGIFAALAPGNMLANLTASGAIAAATLSWTASTDNVAVTSYNVHRSTTGGFPPAAA